MAQSSTPASPSDIIQPDASRDYRRDVMRFLEHEDNPTELVEKYVEHVPQGIFYDIMNGSGTLPPSDATLVVYWLYQHFASALAIAGVTSGKYVITGFHRDVWMPIVSKRGVVDLRSMPYEEFLKTEHWRGVRVAALERADGRCQVCYSDDRLEVHHRTYERRGNERNSDVIVLCRLCHGTFHGKPE